MAKSASKKVQQQWAEAIEKARSELKRPHPALVNVKPLDAESFDLLLTRVPCIGEEVIREDRTYRITRVMHEGVDTQGYARFGWHAFLDAELMPPDEEPPKKSRRRK